MDQAQKDKVDSMAVEISEKINAQDFARKLLVLKLVAKNDIEDIMTRFNSDFSRNMKLLHAARESECDTAYSDLIEILDELDFSCESRVDRSPKTKKSSSIKSLLGSFKDRFGMKGRYPLGLHFDEIESGCSPSSTSHIVKSSHHHDLTSPLKEKHQSTVISSMSSAQQECDCVQADLENQSTRSIFERNMDFSSPPGRSQGMSNQAKDRFSQTPARPNENRMARLDQSICESELQRSLSSSGAEGQEQPQLESDSEPVIAWHPYAHSPIQENAPRASSPQHYHTCYSSASSESGDSTSDSYVVDPNHLLDPEVMTAIAREGQQHIMQVKRATACHNNPAEDYKMTAQPRGLCLIVNNINFEDDIFPTRKGSDEDANRFDQIYRQLGFQTIMTRNLTADQMKAKFKELSDACKPEHDALFVFILSHGSEYGIFGTDGLEVNLENQIIKYFDNRHCKAMLGKPKVFVIQACRGRAHDCGGEGDTTDSIAWAPAIPGIRSLSQENRVPNSWLPTQPSDGKKRKHPIRTDMLLVFSCLAGFVSVRNETAGSWLGVALAYFIMTHAHEYDLEGILKLVTNDIIQRESSQGHIQSIETKLLGWTKRLYFNPGIHV